MAERKRALLARIGRSTARPAALDTAVFVFPLFLIYQLGIASGGAGRNGADFLTAFLIELSARDPGKYLLLLAALLLAYGVL